MMYDIYGALNPLRFVAQGSQFTYALVGDEGLTTYLADGSSRPCQANDVLSIQPDGSPQGRVTGTAGGYELFTAAGNIAEFRPLGESGSAYLVACGTK